MSVLITKFPNVVSSVRNPIGIKLQCDPNWDTFDDYYLAIVIKYEKVFRSGTFETLISTRTTPDENGVVEIDISGDLEAVVNNDQPNTSLSGGAVCQRIQRRYQFTFSEYQNGVSQGTYNGSYYFAVNSGFKFRTGQELYNWVFDYKALTHAPRTRDITINFVGWMYFCVNANTSSVDLNATITYDDDTTENVTLFSLSGVAQWDIVYFPVGYQQTGMHTKAKQVKSYEFWLEDDGSNEISDHHIYQLRRKCTSLDRYYVFENSLGGFDTLHTRGVAKAKDLTESKRVSLYVGPFYTLLDRQEKIYNTLNQHMVEQTVGLVKKTEMIWLRDLFRSEWAFRIGDIYPQLEHSTELVPIEIDKGSTDLFEDNVFLSEPKFTYTDDKGRGI